MATQPPLGDTIAEVRRTAHESDDGRYRLWLRHEWDDGGRILGWVMLNPSTADAYTDDPTIRRVSYFTRTLGFDGFEVRNLFSYRATDPNDLRDRPTATIIGPGNDDPIGALYAPQRRAVEAVIVAWGSNGARWPHRVRRVVGPHPKKAIWHFGVTRVGRQPRHPLYLPSGARPEPAGP